MIILSCCGMVDRIFTITDKRFMPKAVIRDGVGDFARDVISYWPVLVTKEYRIVMCGQCFLRLKLGHTTLKAVLARKGRQG